MNRCKQRTLQLYSIRHRRLVLESGGLSLDNMRYCKWCLILTQEEKIMYVLKSAD